MKPGSLVVLVVCIVSFPTLSAKSQENYASAETLREVSGEIIIVQADAASFVSQGFEQLNQDNYQAAVRSANRALQIDSQMGEAYILRSRAQAKLGNQQAAIQDITEAIRLLPNGQNKAQALYDRAKIFSASQEPLKAIADLTAALRVIPSSERQIKSRIHFLRGFIRSENNQALGAIDDFDKALELNPNYLEAYVQRGLTFEGYLKDTVTALPDYLAAVELNPQDSAEAYWNRGAAHIALGNLRAATADFNSAIELDNQYVRPYIARAFIRGLELDLESFQFGFEEALAINSEDFFARLLIADAFRDFADLALSSRDASVRESSFSLYESSLGILDDVIDQYDNKPFSYLSRGLVFLSNDRPIEALRDFSKALSLEPNYALAYYYRGVAHAQNRNQAGALADFDRAIQLSPNFAEAYLYRGSIKINLGNESGVADVQEAIRLLGEIIQLNPNDANAYLQISEASSLVGNTEAANTARQQALQISQQQGNLLLEANIENLINAQSGSTISPPLVEEFGELVVGGPTLDDNSLYQVHTFEGTKDQQIVITMFSVDFDTYLGLIGPDGEQIASNDDVSESSTNSRIVATLSENGTYKVFANAFDENGIGRYALTVNVQPDNGFILRASGTLDLEEFTLNDGSAYTAYFFEGRDGQPVTIDMTSSEFDTYLILRGPDNSEIAFNDDISAANTNSQITTILPSNGMYTIWVNGYDENEQGQYSISVK